VRHVGRYEVRRALPHAGEYEAFDPDHPDRKLVLHTVGSLIAGDGTTLRAHLSPLLRVSSPSFLRLYDIVEDASGRYLVGEAPPGPSLAQMRGDDLPFTTRLRLVLSLSQAMADVHAAQLAPRNLTSADAYVAPDFEVRLDLAAWALRMLPRYQTPPDLGSFRYQSPEELRGERIDARSAVFSTAAIAYECLTGHPPFEGVGAAVAFAIIKADPQPPRAHEARIPVAIERCLMKAMEKERDRRFADAAELRDALREAWSPERSA
jgi:eukaryotic-like serine/threonine-protein kinase